MYSSGSARPNREGVHGESQESRGPSSGLGATTGGFRHCWEGRLSQCWKAIPYT